MSGKQSCVLAVACLGVCVGSVGHAAPPKRAAVLCLTPKAREVYGKRSLKAPARVAQELKDRGFERAWHVGWDDLTREQLRKFNAIIFYDMPSSPPRGPSPKIAERLELFRDYVRDGGSVFVATYPYTGPKIVTANAFLKPLGARILWELVRDERTLYTLNPPCPALKFSWTDAFAPGPLTKGLRGLYYGVGFWEPGSPTTCPVVAEAPWQMLVRALESGASLKVNPSASDTTGPGTIGSAPGLVAVRKYGKGRVVVWSSSLVYTLMDGYNWMLEDGIVMHGDAAGRRSDGAELIYRLLAWLAEPSLEAGTMGGYVHRLPASPRREDEPGFRPFDWTRKTPIKPMYARAFKGLIGAQTALSCGRGTPEEFITAARTAGYDFIAFTEDLETLTADGWKQLVSACDKGTSATFNAIPGLFYRTAQEAPYVTFGRLLSYPQPEWLEKGLAKRRLRENNCFVRGLSAVPPIIMVSPRSNPRPLRVNAQFYGFATHTYEADKLVDESVTSYLELQREGLMLFPAAVHFVRSPDEVARAARAGMQMCIRADDVRRVVRTVQGFHRGANNPGWCKPAYVSSGPEIQWFYAVNWGTADLTVRNGDRHRLQVLARSPAGVREVTIHDGTVLWRRFLPGDTKTFERNIDNFHDRQHSYVMQVTDAAGAKAISWGRNTQVQECNHDMCGDNWNDMPSGKYKSDSGVSHLRGTECSISRGGGLWKWPMLLNQTAMRFAALKKSGIVTRFGWIVDYSLDHVYDGPGWVGIAYDGRKVSPNPILGGWLREHYFARRPPGPHLRMLEGQVTFRKDVVLKGTPGLAVCAANRHNPGRDTYDHYVYPLPDGQLVTVARSGRKDWGRFVAGTVEPGQYLAGFPLAAGVFPLDKPLEFMLNALPNGTAYLFAGLGKSGQTVRKGTTWTWRVAGLTATDSQGDYPYARDYYPGLERSTILTELVRQRMGLTGAPGYQVKAVVGQVESTQLVLRLKASAYGFRGTISQVHLPVPLPVYVAGLCPSWSAGVWYKGRCRLLSPEWPPYDEFGWGSWTRHSFVVPRTRVDEIQRIAILDGVGFLQVDTEDADRDVYIGNLVVCDHTDLSLALFRDPKRTYVDAHNPTDKPIRTTLRPGPGFDLLGRFEEAVEVAPGTTVTVDIPASQPTK